ncbi:hypothetical protein, partial [Povalibacter sp.]|uniref:hypothetical protein n=1 Tax=Povalibacter sp. TaxID=1962978 RepID=UPI002F42B63F
NSTFTADAGQSITLGQANTFTGAVAFVGDGGTLNNVTVRDTTALTLRPLSVAGNLTATAAGITAEALTVGGALNLTASSGDISQTGALNVTGNSTFTAGVGQSIVLGEANTFNGTVSFVGSGGNLDDVTVRDTTNLDLQTLTITGDLVATAATLTQSGALSVAQTSTFRGNQGTNLVLDNSGNALQGAVSFGSNGPGTLQNVTLRNSLTTNLGASTAGGALDVTATSGSITQSGALAIGGASTFTAAVGSSVTLNNAGNSSGGAVSFVGNGGALANVAVTNTTALTLQALSITGDLSATATSIDAQALTVGGDLDLTATTGGISQTAAMNVTGSSTFTADAGESITLGEANTFTGSVSFIGDGGNLDDVTVRDTTALTLQAMSIGGDLTATAAGLTTGAIAVGGNLNLTVSSNDISQMGALNVTGNSTFTANVSQSITLGEANTFTGTVSFVGSGGSLGNVTVRDSNALTLQAMTITGDLSAAGASIVAQALTVGGDLDLTAMTGGISQTGALTVAGNSTFTADAGQSIALGQANTFSGAVSFVGDGGNLDNVTVRDSNALDLQALSIDGDLTATAGSITQSGALTIGGTAAFTAATGQSIALTNAGNDFTGVVTFAGSGGNLANVSVRDSSALTIDALTLNGDLTINAASISQSGALIIGGNSSFTANGGESIALDDTDNAFTGTVGFAARSGTLQDVAITNSSALDLQAMTISGDLTAVGASLTLSGALAVGGTAILTSSAGMALNTTTADALTVNAAGAVTQAGALNISGATTINATGQNVTLTNADNAFDGAIAITAASASLANSGTTTLAASTLATSLTVDSTGAISQTGALNVAGGSTTLTSDAGVALNTINSDTLTVNAGGAVTQSNALTVTGSTTINATGQTVTLDSVTNAFTGSVGINAANATLTNSLATNLAGSTVSNGLTVNSTGSITQSGALGVAGTSTFNAVGQNVTLTNAANALGSVAVTAANASLTSSVATTLLASTLDNDLTVNSTGAITQAGAIDVTAGTATLNSGAGISLHTFDANTLSITAGGAVTQSGTVTVSGATTIAATGQNVTLNDAANAFGGGIAVSGSNVSLGSAGSVDLHASTISGNLAVTSSTGTVSQSGALNVAGNSTFTAADAQSILLTNTANAFGGGVGLTSAGTLDNVSLAAASNLALQGLSISGDLNITAGGALIQTGALTVAGDADFRTLNVGSNIVLTGANQFGSVSATSAGGVSITQGTGDMNLRQISGTGPVRLEASAGSIVDDTVDVAPATVTSNAGVELVALNNIGTVTDLLTRQGTAIAVNTNGGSLAARVTSVNGQVNLGLPSGSAPTAAASAIRAGGSGRLLIQSAGDLSLTASNSAITGFSEIGFSADGILNVPGAQADLISGPLTTFYLRGGADIARTDRTFNLSAGHLVFDSGSQGGDVTLNTSAGRIDASVGGGASFTVQNSGDLVLGTVNAANNLIIRGAHLRDDGDAGTTTRVSAGGAILLDASAGIGEADGVGSGRIDTVASSVTVNAGAGSVYLSHSGDLQISGNAAAGAIDVIAPTGNITVASTLRANGPLTLVAGTAGSITGNITLAGTAQSAGTATLTAANGGVIMDANDAATHLIAQSATLSAASIGSQANTLGVEIGSLNATVNGDVYVNAVNALQLRSIDAATAVINATGAITDDGDNATRVTAQSLNLSGTSIGAASVGGEIDTTTDRLSASASAGGIYVGESGDLQLAALSAAGAGNSIVIRAEGAIMDDGDSATRISGGGLTLTGASIGAPGAAIDTQVGLLNATAAGGVFINEADDLQVNSVSGTDIVLTAGGALTDDGNDATRISGTDIRLSATRIGAADNRIDTAVSSLTTIATAGGIFVAEQDDVALAEVRSSGTGNIVDIRTGGNGNMTVQTLVTQGGTVTLTSGGTGSITVTGGIESNNGVVNLISGNALALPGLDTGTGSVTLRTVNDLNVGTITSSSVSIISDTGNVSLGTINASGGTVTVTANNGTITDGDDTSLTARDATLSARAIGGPDQALNLAVDNLTATATAGGIYINDLGALRLNSINATGVVSIVTTGALTQAAGITSGGSDIEIFAESILMQAGASTLSGNGNISYVANSGTVSLETLDAGTGRALVIAADSVYSTLAPASGIDNLSGSLVEIRAGGLAGTKGEIGTLNAPITITTPTGAGRSVYLIVPAVNGIQTTTPSINYSGSSASLLLKGYTGTTGALLFDLSSTFSPETLLGGSETIVPLANGRVAVNSDSLSAAKQALSSGVISRVNVDWAAFDPNVSLFGTLDPSLRLPADQIDEEELPTASLIPEGTVLTMTRDGWELRRDM